MNGCADGLAYCPGGSFTQILREGCMRIARAGGPHGPCESSARSAPADCPREPSAWPVRPHHLSRRPAQTGRVGRPFGSSVQTVWARCTRRPPMRADRTDRPRSFHVHGPSGRRARETRATACADTTSAMHALGCSALAAPMDHPRRLSARTFFTDDIFPMPRVGRYFLFCGFSFSNQGPINPEGN